MQTFLCVRAARLIQLLLLLDDLARPAGSLGPPDRPTFRGRRLGKLISDGWWMERIIGVLFGWFAYKIEGPGLDGVYSIYQGHLFFQKATYGKDMKGCYGLGVRKGGMVSNSLAMEHASIPHIFLLSGPTTGLSGSRVQPLEHLCV